MAIAGYPLHAIVDAIATFEAKQQRRSLPEGADARYLLGIVRNVHPVHEADAITQSLLRQPVEARDHFLASLLTQRDTILGKPELDEHLDALTRQLVEADRELDRHLWLDALLLVAPADHDARYNFARRCARRIHASFALGSHERHRLVRMLLRRLWPLDLGVLQTLLFQADFRGASQAGTFSGMFWAVTVEFQLYFVFPFLHRFLEQYGMRWALSCIALRVLMRLMAAYGGTSNPRDIAYGHVLGRLDQFVIGMLTAHAFRRLESRQLPWGFLALMSTAIVLAVLTAFNRLGGYPSQALWKVAWPTLEAIAWAQLIVTYTRFAERIPQWLSTPLTAYGSISYSIYLLHSPCIVLLARLRQALSWHPNPNSAALLFVALGVLPVLVPLATLSYQVVERPFLGLRVQYLRSESRKIAPDIAR